MQVVGWLRVVLILGILSVLQARRITPSERNSMQNAMFAGYRFTAALRQEDFQLGMNQVQPFAISWTMGFKLFTGFLGIFEPEDTRILDAITNGFTQVNRNLDQIKDQLTQIKNIIKWADMKVKFGEIESQIRLMDAKLMSAVRAPNKRDGINDFLRTYTFQYRQAGFNLYDAIVSNDQIFSRNLLKAAMHYSDNHRPNIRRFMKGLMSLVVKAANIEIAEEQFIGANRGESAKWFQRLIQVRDAMQKADNHLGVVWKTQVIGEIERKCEEFKNVKHHYQFTHAILYGVLHDKYSFMNWHVMSYDPVGGFDRHTVYVRNAVHFVNFRKYRRNIVVVATEKKAPWNHNFAQGLIKDRQCPYDRRHCSRHGAQVILNQTPVYGNSKVFIQKDIKNHVRSSRHVAGVASLYKGSRRINQYIGIIFG